MVVRPRHAISFALAISIMFSSFYLFSRDINFSNIPDQSEEGLWSCKHKLNTGINSFSSKDPAHVVFIGHYSPGKHKTFFSSIRTALKSLLWNRRVPLHIHLVGNEFTHPEKWASVLNKCKYQDVKVFAHKLPDVGLHKHFNKLLLQQTLSRANVDKVIQLDFDIIVLDDIGKLWSKFDEFKAQEFIGIAPEFNAMYDESSQHIYHNKENCIHGIESKGHTGFNTGVVLFDIKKMNDWNWSSKLESVQKDTNKCHLPMSDQDVINELLYRHRSDGIVKLIPNEWNTQLFCFMDYDLNCKNYSTPNSPSILHWNGEIKDTGYLIDIIKEYERLDPSFVDTPYSNYRTITEGLLKLRSDFIGHKNIKHNV
ncbi:glycosyltransferase-like protein [Acrasis kona]|uniref:Glycosyltransferase-like protein n=1 Tax=Acrasis kona TaxID=1008807 RepID=A0AAW2Z828_9EUKA